MRLVDKIAALANSHTPGRRRAMTCGYMPDGCTFNGQANVLPPEYVATLSEGDALDNDGLNPLLYHARGGGAAG